MAMEKLWKNVAKFCGTEYPYFLGTISRFQATNLDLQ